MPSKSKQEWVKNVLEPALKHFPERQSEFSFTSGTEIQPLYTSEDLKGVDLEESLGYPGEHPYAHRREVHLRSLETSSLLDRLPHSQK